MSARTIKIIFDGFFEEIGRLDAPYGDLVDRAFRAHLLPISDQQVPSEMRAEWRHWRWAWFQAESEDDLLAKYTANPFQRWTPERQNSFMDKLHDLRRQVNDITIAD